MHKRFRRSLGVTLLALAAIAIPHPAAAQLSGHNILGENGLQSASQPAPGFYVAGVFQNYHASTIRNRYGDTLPTESTLNLGLVVPAVSLVTPVKILGANYGFLATFPSSGSRLEFPRLNVSGGVRGYTDMYVRPLELGWHTKRPDILAGYAFFAPTGRFRLGAERRSGARDPASTRSGAPAADH